VSSRPRSAGRPGPRTPRPAAPSPHPSLHRGPAAVPLERARAGALLGGLLAFTVGFAAAGVVVAARWKGGGLVYVIGLCLGLVGIGLVGFFYHRGSAQLPEARLWSPELLRAVIEPLRLPPVPVISALYLFTAIGVLGNLVIPLTRRH